MAAWSVLLAILALLVAAVVTVGWFLPDEGKSLLASIFSYALLAAWALTMVSALVYLLGVLRPAKLSARAGGALRGKR